MRKPSKGEPRTVFLPARAARFLQYFLNRDLNRRQPMAHTHERGG